jgi:5-methylcytosine-specific restriction endonuclease McrA
LAVHHIVPFRLTHDHSPSNLRTLCASCHSTIENEFLWLL